MTKSQILCTHKRMEIEIAVLGLINSHPPFLSAETAASTRATGDAIQTIISEHLGELLGDLCAEYFPKFPRRAMGDLAFRDTDGLYYAVDVKTHRAGTQFSMPNLTSAKRLARFYERDTNYFAVLIVKYTAEATEVIVEKVCFVPIEWLSWQCLTIGALGWGQVQIADANVIDINEGYSRKAWMIELCDSMLQFYPKEVEKIITHRIDYFEGVREEWEEKAGA
jgi:hypothetical protein